MIWINKSDTDIFKMTEIEDDLEYYKISVGKWESGN